MKSIMKRILVMTLAVIMVVAPITASATEKQDTILYLALGDSITEGDSSYVQYINAHLEEQCNTLVTQNLGVSGCRAVNIATAITDPANEAYESLRYGITVADVITLDIGSNDILMPVINVMCEYFECTPETLGTTMEEWGNKFNNETDLYQKWLIYNEVMTIATNIHEELYNGTTMPNAIAEFKASYSTIIDTILELNPDVKLYLGNVYNPYHGFAPLMVNDYEMLDLESFTEEYVLIVNDIVEEKIADRYPIVDIYSEIKDSTLLLGDPTVNNYDPHPNADGHKLIGELFVAVM